MLEVLDAQIMYQAGNKQIVVGRNIIGGTFSFEIPCQGVFLNLKQIPVSLSC